jgi:protein O-mannosyl-transferase
VHGLFRLGSRWDRYLAPGLILLLGFAAYRNGFTGPFIFDDPPSILENSTIRRAATALFPPTGGLAASGRPIVNLSLAINYSVSGSQVWSYHVLNVGILILSGLILWRIAVRSLLLPRFKNRFEADASILALFIALFWTVHPLQTESVDYVIQRAESLVGLFYLLTLYFVILGAEPGGSKGWYVLAILACYLGAGSKEVIVTLPFVVLLFDRTFLAGTFREAWKTRWPLYLGLMSSWILVSHLLATTEGKMFGFSRAGLVGINIGVPWWKYALTQIPAVIHYLRLSLWPDPLVFEYGTFWVTRIGEVVPYALVLLPLLIVTVIGLVRNSPVGFLGSCFFIILAPTSVVPGASQMIVEHRMYLPLAAVAGALVMGAYLGAGRPALIVFVPVILVFVILTDRRSEDYRSDVAIWSDTVSKRPENMRARNFLAHALALQGRWREAVDEFEVLERGVPDYPPTENDLADALTRADRLPEALVHYRALVRLIPDVPWAHMKLASALVSNRRPAEAIEQFKEALRLGPDSPEIHFDIGTVDMQLSEPTEAIGEFETALRLRPAYADAHNNLAAVFVGVNRIPEAIQHYQEALRMAPDDIVTYINLGDLLFRSGRFQEARESFRHALMLQPGFEPAQKKFDEANARCAAP